MTKHPVNSDYCRHCNTIGQHRTTRCPATGGSSSRPLPSGAEYATDFDNLGSRVVFSEDYNNGPAIVKASCYQGFTGSILDDPVDEGPRVNVMIDAGTTLTVRQARELAAAVFLAAVQAEAWAIEAAQDRHPAGKQRPPGLSSGASPLHVDDVITTTAARALAGALLAAATEADQLDTEH